MTSAGTEWTYPLTAEPLEACLNNPRSHSFNIVDEEQNATVGHAQILLNDDGTCKIDKLIIGNPAHRGKGLCQQAVKALLAYAFTRPPVHTADLNVFDWNSTAIRCYEKIGFTFNPTRTRTFEVDGQEWIAVNMSIRKSN